MTTAAPRSPGIQTVLDALASHQLTEAQMFAAAWHDHLAAAAGRHDLTTDHGRDLFRLDVANSNHHLTLDVLRAVAAGLGVTVEASATRVQARLAIAEGYLAWYVRA